ncbi:MAG: hypothetical protein KJ995_08250 [Candidatus Omnitrophica bacterium]|nr:hypothetical protein [Candidatus Omnitrophota bacterium]MBU1785283.1 hypothetical protein [Candidatus Omnitrophota bacterium]MBU1852378.1 hypothetical protein [Candidatus Omnitrophota bacterium]
MTDLTLGERALEWSKLEEQDGVCEEPLGSSTGKRIREYFAPATRVIKGQEVKLGLRKGHWCAVACCAATYAVLLDDEVAPTAYRCSGFELENDAKASGLWRPKALVLDGGWVPAPGDVCILDRGGGWKRHVARVVHAGNSSFVTLGGNEQNRWRFSDRRYDNEDLLGFIEFPRPYAVLSASEATRLYELSRGVMAGEGDDLEAIMADVDKAEKRG